MNQINVVCPYCHQAFSVSNEFAGRQAFCPQCGNAVAVPTAFPQNCNMPDAPVSVPDIPMVPGKTAMSTNMKIILALIAFAAVAVAAYFFFFSEESSSGSSGGSGSSGSSGSPKDAKTVVKNRVLELKGLKHGVEIANSINILEISTCGDYAAVFFTLQRNGLVFKEVLMLKKESDNSYTVPDTIRESDVDEKWWVKTMVKSDKFKRDSASLSDLDK